MNSTELDREAGFIASSRVQVLKNKYQEELELQCANILDNPYDLDFTNVWGDIQDHILEYHSQYDLDVFLHRCLRDECLRLIRFEKAAPSQNNEALKEFAKHPGAPMSDGEKEEICMFLSMMNRKQFDYFIKRYFYFDPDTQYDTKLEKQIQKIFQLRGDASVLRWMRITPNPTCDASFYVRCLEGLSDFFLDQIHTNGTIVSHPSVNKYQSLQLKLYMARRIAPLAIAAGAICCALIYFGIL